MEALEESAGEPSTSQSIQLAAAALQHVSTKINEPNEDGGSVAPVPIALERVVVRTQRPPPVGLGPQIA